jgi:5-methylcytosine-specific restriction enzyme A
MTTKQKRHYDKSFWRRVRRQHLKEFPLCELCASNAKVTVATCVHHAVQHHHDYTAFRLSPLQSLCDSCHNSIMQSREKKGFDKAIGTDGWPLDPAHPVYREGKQKWSA